MLKCKDLIVKNMIDLKQAFTEGTNNIRAWRNRYSRSEYPHKIVINIMYRAYIMTYVWKAFENRELQEFGNFQEAVTSMEQTYGAQAWNVNPYLMDWLQNYPSREVGGITFASYDRIADKAEYDKKSLEEIEFSYLFNLLQDKCVLYWISLRQTGQTQTEAIGSLTDVLIEELPNADYKIMRNVFGQLIVARYLDENYTQLS